MGMFDYVRCDVPLPDGFEGELQTKDFDCPYMEVYTITADGRLMERYVEREEPVPEAEWKYVGATDPLEKMWHLNSKRKPIYAQRDLNFHGWLNFYGSSGQSPQDPAWQWHEYKAKFTDGQLVEIELVPDRDSEGQVTISNESGSTDVSLNPDTSLPPQSIEGE
jgi:hypothetical protein